MNNVIELVWATLLQTVKKRENHHDYTSERCMHALDTSRWLPDMLLAAVSCGQHQHPIWWSYAITYQNWPFLFILLPPCSQATPGFYLKVVEKILHSFSRLQKSCNKQGEQWKTTIDFNTVLNQEKGHAEAGKIIRFICGKSIVVFHCSAYLLQDFLQSAVQLLLSDSSDKYKSPWWCHLSSCALLMIMSAQNGMPAGCVKYITNVTCVHLWLILNLCSY